MPKMTKDGQPVWKKQYEYAKLYESEYAVRFNMKLNKKTDMDIIDAMNAAPNKQGFFKEAIRFYLANQAADDKSEK